MMGTPGKPFLVHFYSPNKSYVLKLTSNLYNPDINGKSRKSQIVKFLRCNQEWLIQFPCVTSENFALHTHIRCVICRSSNFDSCSISFHCFFGFFLMKNGSNHYWNRILGVERGNSRVPFRMPSKVQSFDSLKNFIVRKSLREVGRVMFWNRLQSAPKWLCIESS